ncbi:hypothetical protein TVAG_499430 [Trichomonas vaginalis G3]|uniref:Uncharacterized protein n=1 Tax=Trichomonas vaginalis (strain ATCC PRA-98 / G3) TaxID=412133 RepID=A2EIN0_TRIV3|nr:hypothetical protein TVAGG3_0960160 [Trichomonas vaginalis G3]EAY07457.1 hypothetical protein TVAG_499430 [Trichomonas vaginalis G3]KAI5487847.1 hypothetical protein TVAGG3_0960160 [Trichomonas vaginalis G3]|eukprot:XP_001319680.1 hypothetical protein [Trichomonas vaginalis G3]
MTKKSVVYTDSTRGRGDFDEGFPQIERINFVASDATEKAKAKALEQEIERERAIKKHAEERAQKERVAAFKKIVRKRVHKTQQPEKATRASSSAVPN